MCVCGRAVCFKGVNLSSTALSKVRARKQNYGKCVCFEVMILTPSQSSANWEGFLGQVWQPFLCTTSVSAGLSLFLDLYTSSTVKYTNTQKHKMADTMQDDGMDVCVCRRVQALSYK